MKGKQVKPTATCEWIKIEPVLGEKCLAETIEELLSFKNVISILEFRCNLLLQRTGFQLSEKLLGETKMHPLDAWNSVQVFYVQDLAKAYGNLFLTREASDRIQAILGGEEGVGSNSDTKEALLLMFRLDALCSIQKDIGTWLEVEYFSAHQVQMIRDSINDHL
jgi:hypothetical protein